MERVTSMGEEAGRLVQARRGGPTLGSLTTVVPNYRNPELTIRCVTALLGDGVPADRIVVVENGSDDDSAEVLRARLPGCRLLELPQNIGYGRACNAAAGVLPGSAYLILNNDAFVHAPGSVARLTAALSHPDASIVVPRLLNEDLTLQTSVLPLHGPAVAVVRASGLSRFLPNHAQPRLATHWDHSYSRWIRSARGAVIMVRADAWRDLGGFDPAFTFFAEELDLFWRLHERRRRAAFIADATFVHLGSATMTRMWGSPERAERMAVATRRLIDRHLPARTAGFVSTVTGLGLAGRWLLRSAQRREDAPGLGRAARVYLGRTPGAAETRRRGE